MTEPFTCPRCGAVSWHPTDKAQGYCGRCRDWTAQTSSGRSVAAVEFITPDRDGQVRVLLTCDCATVTDLSAEAVAQEAAFVCAGCLSVHWFTVTACS